MLMQGFLRNERLLQTMGRAARNQNGRVILYALGMSPSMSGQYNKHERQQGRSLQSRTHGAKDNQEGSTCDVFQR